METPEVRRGADERRSRSSRQTLWTLLALTLLAGFGIRNVPSWVRQATAQRHAVETLNKVGATAWYDYQIDADGRKLPTNSQLPRAVLLCDLLSDAFGKDFVGKDLVASVVDVSFSQDPAATDADLEHLKALTHLKRLSLRSTNVTDAGMQNLKGLVELQWLSLSGTQITDAGLQNLKGLVELQWLSLSATQITDAGLEHLKELPQLFRLELRGTQVTDAGLGHLEAFTTLLSLDLSDTRVTDARLGHLEAFTTLLLLNLSDTRVTDLGLQHLARLTHLRQLYLNGTHVTDQAIKNLQQALPKCRIFGLPAVAADKATGRAVQGPISISRPGK